MANNNFSVKSWFSKRNLKKVWSFIVDCGKTAAKGALIGLYYLGVGILCLLGFVFIANPVAFYIWSLLFPKGMADLCVTDDVGDIVSALNFPVIRLLPWWSKKRFMECRFRSNCREYSDKDQMKYFRKVDHSVDYLKRTSQSFRDYLWKHGILEEKSMLVDTHYYKLSLNQFRELIENNLFEVAKGYATYAYTPTGDMVLSILDKIDDPQAWELLKAITIKHGLREDLLSKVVEHLDNEKREQLYYAQQIHAQRNIITKYRDNRIAEHTQYFGNWCKQVEVLPEAQKWFNLWQYQAYHNAGRKLDDLAVAEFVRLAADNSEASEQLLAAVLANETLSEASKAVISRSTAAQRVIAKMVKRGE
jgi:hypothetical protein